MSRTPNTSPGLDEATLTFIEDFAFAWGAAGNPRMEGRVLALLLITDEPHLSLSQIAGLLNASTGAVSMSTRALMNLGFLKPHSIPGDRNRYFRTEEDVWGSFLRGRAPVLHARQRGDRVRPRHPAGGRERPAHAAGQRAAIHELACGVPPADADRLGEVP